MKPYYDHNGITIYHADCRELLPWIVKHYVVDLLLTDPPYGISERTSRKANGRSNATESIDWAPVEGDSEPFNPSHLLGFNRTILWGANHYSDTLPASSSWLVWDKRDGTTPDDNADCELAWSNLGGPVRMYRHLWRGMIKASERNETRLHPTQKPVRLFSWCIQRAKLKPGDLIIDPYMGSGPIAQAAMLMGMRYIGIEIHESYCETTVRARNLSQQVMRFEVAA